MNRQLLKENAKKALKHNFLLVMLVVFVASLLGVNDINISYNFNVNIPHNNEIDYYDDYDEDYTKADDIQQISLNDIDYEFNEENSEILPDIFTGTIAAVSIGVIIISIIVVILAILWTTFLTNPIKVGYRKFFMKNRSGQGEFMDLFSSFGPNYLNIVKTMFGTNIRIFGWSLLFVVPGIIKSYEYFFVPFILCENPTISGDRAREISSQMTKGQKWNIFVLELSFIGWILIVSILSIPALLLTCCCLGIGAQLIYMPLSGYVSATYAELYEERREYALYNGISYNNELVGFDKFMTQNNENVNMQEQNETINLDLNKSKNDEF